MRRLMCPVAEVPAALGWGGVIGPQVAMAGRVAALLWDVPARAACPAAYAD